MQPGKKVSHQDDRAQCYAFLGNNEAEACDVEITCTILVCNQIANVLFDLGFTYSSVSLRFTLEFYVICDVFDASIHVSTTVEELFIVTYFYHAYPILFMGFKTWADLVILDMTDFDIIFGMTWLSHYNGLLN